MGLFDFVDDVVGGVTKKATSIVADPIGTVVRTVTRPIADGINVVDGLTEGELRIKAAARLGVDAVSSMALGELVSWYND